MLHTKHSKVMLHTLHNKIRLPKTMSRRQRAGLIICLAFIGLGATLLTQAAISSVSIELENGARSGNVSPFPISTASGGNAIQFGTKGATACGKQVQNYTYQVPFGNAVWNQPVCQLPRYARSADYANRFYKWSNLNDGQPSAQQVWGDLGVDLGFQPPRENWTRNVYNAKDATTQTQIIAVSWESNLDGIKYAGGTDPDRLSFLPNAYIPWNPNWRTGEAGDNEIVIIDESNGRIYEIFGYKPPGLLAFSCLFHQDRICTNTVGVGRDHTGKYFDYRTFEGPTGSRGVGIHSYASLVMPEEVIAGEIRHAMGVAIPNPATGPECTAAQKGTAAEGKTCGVALIPANKFEQGGDITPEKRYPNEPYRSIYTQDKLIPEGMRFAIDITDAQIDNWVNSRADLKADSRKAQTARIFARAMRDYGIIIADTSGVGAGIQVAGIINPDTKQKWASVGMDDPSDANLLEGLITSTNLYVVEPPTAKCLDGQMSKYFCNWITASY